MRRPLTALSLKEAKKRMATIDGNRLSSMLVEEITLRKIEPNIYSVLPNDESGNDYDSQFGFIYDLIACSPMYNRFIWGYSVKIFAKIVNDALRSTPIGDVLDIGCGSLAFTDRVYSQFADRSVVLVDQSLKMLRMAKSRLIKLNGKFPGNLVLLHSDALHLKFRENAFTTIISENLLHCLEDTRPLLKQLTTILTEDGKIYFTTLVQSDRWADKYLQSLAHSGKLISRSVDDHKEIFKQVGLVPDYETIGNILSIQCENVKISDQGASQDGYSASLHRHQ